MAHTPALFCGSGHLHTRSSLSSRLPQLIGRLNVRRLALHHRSSSAGCQGPRRHPACRSQAASNVEVAEAPVAQAEPAPEADALAEAPAEAAASQDGAAEEEATAQKPALGKRWVEAIRLQEEGAVCEGKIRSLHKAGVVVELKTHKLRGFLPWMRMDRTRLPDPATAAQEDLNSLLSKTVSVKVLQVNIPKRQLLLSEQAALQKELAAHLKEGDIVEGVVHNTAPFGAFVKIKGPDGQMRGLSGMIHVSEMGWSRVEHPDDVVRPGQALRCKVIQLDREKDKVYLSLKEMESDPLLENLDGLLPLGVDAGAPSLGSVPAHLPSAVEDLCAALMAEPGIDDVSVRRQVEEKRAVAQDLELWMAKGAVEDGHNLVVRAGRLVQEIHVATALPAEDMRAVVQRVLRQLV